MPFELFRMMARYNEWANTRIYHAVGALPDDPYRGDLGAFFGSIHRTLNHLLVADRIWMARFTGATDDPATRLDAILYEELSELAAARAVEDTRIIKYVDELDDAALAGSIHYRTIVTPQDITQPLAPALLHFFNHQTHHRGQVHAMLTRVAGAAPSLDLIMYQREAGL
jgi:uncharacterized damage-inducible protein DinB